MSTSSSWPSLPLSEWSDTCETLHRWTQIVGKVRMALTPLVNHWWNVTLYVTVARAHHVADCPWRAHLRNRFRLRRPSAVDRNQRRRDRAPRAWADVGRRFLRRAHGPAAASRHRGAHLDHAERDRERRSLRAGSRARSLRSGHGAAVLACPRPGRTACSRPSAPASSARSAPCTSSGAVSTWRSRAFPAARRRRPAASRPTWRAG